MAIYHRYGIRDLTLVTKEDKSTVQGVVKGEMGNTVAARNKCHNGSILFLYLTDK